MREVTANLIAQQRQNQQPMPDKEALRITYSYPAPYCNNIFITATDGLFRITFCESIPDIGEYKARTAVTLSGGGLMQLGQMIGHIMEQLQKQMVQQQQAEQAKSTGNPTLDDLITRATTKDNLDG